MAYNNTPRNTTKLTQYSRVHGQNMVLPIETTLGVMMDKENRKNKERGGEIEKEMKQDNFNYLKRH